MVATPNALVDGDTVQGAEVKMSIFKTIPQY